jgi:hypothetical protein
LANEKEPFIAEKQSFPASGALAGYCEHVQFCEPKEDAKCFSVNLHPKSTVKANLLLRNIFAGSHTEYRWRCS